MHGFLRKANHFGKSALQAAGTAHAVFQAGKQIYEIGKAVAPVAGPILAGSIYKNMNGTGC